MSNPRHLRQIGWSDRSLDGASPNYDGQLDQRSEDGVLGVPRNERLLGDFDALELPEQDVESDFGFKPRKRGAHAEVDAFAERDGRVIRACRSSSLGVCLW